MDTMNPISPMNPMEETTVAMEGETQEAPTNKLAIPVLVLLVVVAAGFAVYFYRQLNVLKQDPQKIAQQEAEALVATVGKLIVLPAGEQPTVATVTDPDKLKDQPFFANTKVGDKVLIYTNAKKAILYNPETNKIVEVAPLNIGNPTK